MGSCLKRMGASRIKRWTVPMSVVAEGKTTDKVTQRGGRETTVQPVVPSAIWQVWVLESSDRSLETVQIVFPSEKKSVTGMPKKRPYKNIPVLGC
jgi:hypothetical protein